MSEPRKVVFRIRRIYFDQIVAGTKTSEFRADKPYWRKVILRVMSDLSEGTRKWILSKGAKFSDPNDRFFFGFSYGAQPIGIFICGKSVHRRYIRAILSHQSARLGLGREPSEQGRKDLGEGAVWEFVLGSVVP